MVGESGTSHVEKNVHHYYKCVTVKHHGECDKKTVRKDWIENLVLEQIQKIVMDDELINNLADMLVTELGKESDALPVLRKELADVEKGIENMLNAIQNGIFTPSTKQRLEALEEQKNELSVKIMQEEMTKPTISWEIFTTYLTHFRTYDITDKEQHQRLVDHFVNVIYLYDDHFDLFLNFREGAVSITFDEDMLKASKSRKGKKADISSDLTPQGAPYRVFITDLRYGHFFISTTRTIVEIFSKNKVYLTKMQVRYQHLHQTLKIRTFYQSVKRSDYLYSLIIRFLTQKTGFKENDKYKRNGKFR